MYLQKLTLDFALCLQCRRPLKTENGDKKRKLKSCKAGLRSEAAHLQLSHSQIDI